MKMWRPTAWQWIAIYMGYWAVGVSTVLWGPQDNPARGLLFLGFMGIAAALHLWDRTTSRT
jgi:hypothetical protein